MEWISFMNHFKQLYQLHFKEIAKKYDLNMIEVNILLFLKNNPSLNTARDIVNYRGLAKSNVSTALEILKKKTYLCIETDQDNRRIQRISITENAKPIIHALRKKQLELFASVHEGFSQEELALMEQFQNRLHDNMITLINQSAKES